MASTEVTPKYLFLKRLNELKASGISVKRLLNDLTKERNKPEEFFASYDFVSWKEEGNSFIFVLHHKETNTSLHVFVPENFPFGTPKIVKNNIILNSRWCPGTKLLKYIEHTRDIYQKRKNIIIGANNTDAHDILNAIASDFDLVVDFEKIRTEHVPISGVKADLTDPDFWQIVFDGFREHFPDCQIGRITFDWSVYKFVWCHSDKFYQGIKKHGGLIDKQTSLFVPYGSGFIPGCTYNVGIGSVLSNRQDKYYIGWFKFNQMTRKLVYSDMMKQKKSFLREFKYLHVNLPGKNYKIQQVPFDRKEIVEHNSNVFTNKYKFPHVIFHQNTMYPINRKDQMQFQIESFYEIWLI